jgi:PAP2 superfamily
MSAGDLRQLTDVAWRQEEHLHGMRTAETLTDSLVTGGGTGEPAADRRDRPRVLPEVALVVGLWFVYNAGRFLAARHTGRAYANAGTVWRLERRLWLPDEAAGQRFLLSHCLGAVRLADDYYRWVHLPATVVVLAVLFRFRPAGYVWVRTAMAYATGVAMVIHIVWPVAPPRMLPRLGFVDTALRFGQSAYGPRGHDHLANEFAAMPSLHVGWAVMLAVAVIATFRTRWRWLALAHPVVTVLVVVVTANHFWLDGVAGTALALAGLAAAPRPAAAGVVRRPISARWPMSAPVRASRLAESVQPPQTRK